MEERFKAMEQRVKNDYEECKLIQIEKEALMREKERLFIDLKGEELKPEQGLSQTSQILYKKVFPLVQEIHSLEIKHKGIQHQLHLLDVQKDVHQIFTSLTSVKRTRRKGKLHSWFQELEAISDEQDEINPPDYRCDERGEKLKERLGLCLSHQGLAVQVTISSQSCTHGENCSLAECTTIADETSVTSDVHIEGLQHHTDSLIQQQSPVSCLVDFIHSALQRDVLPYL